MEDESPWRPLAPQLSAGQECRGASARSVPSLPDTFTIPLTVPTAVLPPTRNGREKNGPFRSGEAGLVCLLPPSLRDAVPHKGLFPQTSSCYWDAAFLSIVFRFLCPFLPLGPGVCVEYDRQFLLCHLLSFHLMLFRLPHPSNTIITHNVWILLWFN